MNQSDNPFKNVAKDIKNCFSFLEKYGFEGKIVRDEGWICEVIYESERFIVFLKFENIAGHFLFSFTDKTTNENQLIWRYLSEKVKEFNYTNYKPDEFGYYKGPLFRIAKDFETVFVKEYFVG